MSALLQDTRFTVAFGPFSGAGPTYTGQVQTIGSTGYTVDDIAVGDGLYDGKAVYLVDSVAINVAGSIATLTVTYQAGDTPDTAPSASRGQITRITSNLGLSLITQVGSDNITPEQLAKILTSNFIKIDAAGLGGGSGGGTVTGGAFIDAQTTGGNTVISLNSGALPAGGALSPDGAGGFAVIPPLTIAPASADLLDYDPLTGQLSATDELVSTRTDAPEADLAAFIAAQYAAGDEFQQGDVVQTADGNIYQHNGGTTGTAADFSTFGATGNVVGSTYVTATPSGDDTVIALDSTSIPAGGTLASDGAGGFTSVPGLTIDPASDPALTYIPSTGVLSLAPSGAQPFTAVPEADLTSFVAAQYTVGDEYQLGDQIQTTDGAIYIHNGGTAGDATDFTQVNTGGTTLLSGIAPDTTGNLLSSQPYAGEERLLVWSTDEQQYYVVGDSGNLSALGGTSTPSPAITYETPAAVSGTVIPIPGMLPTSDVVALYIDNTFLYPSEYTQGTGDITLIGAAGPAVDSFFFARLNN